MLQLSQPFATTSTVRETGETIHVEQSKTPRRGVSLRFLERKLTRTRAVFAYEGDIQGEGTAEYLMAYSPNGVGNFVGLERIVGHVAGRPGSFVIQHTGTFDPKSVTTRWLFVPGSGTGELEGISGGGEVVLVGHGPYPITFDYDFK